MARLHRAACTTVAKARRQIRPQSLQLVLLVCAVARQGEVALAVRVPARPQAGGRGRDALGRAPRCPWKTGPEHFMRRKGFFVHQRSTRRTRATTSRSASTLGSSRFSAAARTRRGQGPKFENGESWFYHTIGSGIFLDTSDLTRPFGVHYRRISAPRCEIICRAAQSLCRCGPQSGTHLAVPSIRRCGGEARRAVRLQDVKQGRECYDAPKFAQNNAARRFDCTPSWIEEHEVIC